MASSTPLLMLLLLAAATLAAAVSISRRPLNEEVWEEWMILHGKAGTYTAAEEAARHATWARNLQFVRQHNAQNLSYKVHMNKFADLTVEEFRAQYLSLYPFNVTQRNGTPFQPGQLPTLPPSVDWREKGWVTPIKNQGQCGSCWAFSTTGSLEGQHANKTGNLVSLSEQNLVDCSGKFGNQGCDGGLMDYAFQYIKANNGIDTEDSYPYKGVDGSCQFNPANVGATLTGYVDIPSGNEQALQEATAAVGPISVAIDASSIGFQLYKYGVYRDPFCSSTNLDHGVLVAGYNNDTTPIIGGEYYLVKNSWGSDWGKEGYIYMARNDNNMCGIATAASYPTV